MRKTLKFAFLLALVSIAQSGSLRAEFIYVSYGSSLLSYALDNKTGIISPLPSSPLPITGGASNLVVAPSNRFLYADTGNPSVVSGYRIKPNGELATLSGSPFKASGGALALDPFDRFLYVADGAQNGSVSVYRIAADGAIKPKPVPGSPFPAGSFPFSIAADPFGRFVYAANAVSKDVSAYQVLENGALVTVPGSPFPITGQGNLVTVAVDPSGRFVYVGNFGGASVSSFRIGSNGALTQLAGSPTKIGGEWLQDLVLDPTGGLLYVLQGETGLESFHIDNTTGALELASAVQSAREVFILAVDPLGKFVYAGNSNDIIPGPVSLSGFHVDSQGVLKPVLGSPFFLPVPDGTSPGSIVIVKRSGHTADQ
jgi:6-phosphogluconolactonase